jgi:hypothetical protein
MTEAEPIWAKYWDELWELLTPLYDAGWAMPEDDTTSSEEDQSRHWTLHQRLMRSCMVFQVTYEQHGKYLTFGPGADETVADEDGIGEYDMFAEPVTVQLGGKTKADRLSQVREAARTLGLLDPTRAQVPDRGLAAWQEFIGSILGSSDYTKRWWGNGWWPDLCEQVIAKFTETGTPLPKPYDLHGAVALLADLTDHPELLPDAVLKACRIGASPKGTEGLGFLQVDELSAREVYPRG